MKALIFVCLALGGAAFATADAARAHPREVIRIAAVGDIMLGTENLLPADEAAGAFAEAAAYLADCHVVFGNLEGPLTDRGAPTKASIPGLSYVFRSPPRYAERLREAGFTVMSLANNHVNDYGPDGYEHTREVLSAAGILHTGAPGQVARQKVGRITVAVIGLAPNRGCQDINDIAAAAELVRREAAQDDTLVLVSIHGGAEGPGRISVPHGAEFFLGENRGDLRRLGRELIDAGAHLVIGHGPHVPRGIEIYKDRVIAFSLGNFATGRGLSAAGRCGLAPLLLVEMTPEGRLAGGRVVSFKQAEAGRPRLDSRAEAAALMHRAGLADFEAPGLTADGRLVTSETAARALAAASGVKARTAADAPAFRPVEKSPPDSAAETVPAEAAPVIYEWDVYRGPLKGSAD